MKVLNVSNIIGLLTGVLLLVSASCCAWKKEKEVNENELVLYVGKGCPYCTRVTDFIKNNNILLLVKDVWTDDEAKKELATLAGKGQVPCLKLNAKGDYMHESLDIIAKLKHIFNQ